VAVDIEIGLARGGRLTGALARPKDGGGPHPGVMVVHEVFGDQPEMRGVCDQFAAHGYVAVMPDLFSGGGPRAICVARAMIESTRPRRGHVAGYIDAARLWLAQQEDVDNQRIGVIGFCMGASFALAYVAGGPPGVRAASINYGEVPSQAASLRRTCPIVASYGGRDMITRSHGERLHSHLEELAIEHDVKLYDDAGHAFMTQGSHPIGSLVFLPMRLGYDPDAAGDSWRRVFAFFDERLQAS
jgi:carboxymethylenebutenolidase